MIDRLIDVLFVQVIRAWLGTEDCSGASMREPNGQKDATDSHSAAHRRRLARPGELRQPGCDLLELCLQLV